ncbi:MAG TPA: nuclear transport factor 2 family protein [Rudaea sp.]|nr:nuclear transport factor 2 family protein [Rudaea sp.]
MTLTRTVTLFSGLENTLDDALRAHDTAALARLVAPTFEVRSAAMPGTPTPRADWLAAALPPKPALSQMAVHDYGEVAVVSFLDAARHAFVVDVWKKAAGDYVLSVRYTSGAAGAAQTRPENPAK